MSIAIIAATIARNRKELAQDSAENAEKLILNMLLEEKLRNAPEASAVCGEHLSFTCEACTRELLKLREALQAISVADWKTSCELRSIARTAIDAAQLKK